MSSEASTALGAGKSAQISILVQQLKENIITKEELFEKLQRLQKGEVVVSAAGSASFAVSQPTVSATVTAAGESRSFQIPSSGQPSLSQMSAGINAGRLSVDQLSGQSRPGLAQSNVQSSFSDAIASAAQPSSTVSFGGQQSGTGLTLDVYLQQQKAIMEAAAALQASARQAGLSVAPMLPGSGNVIDATIRRPAPVSGARLARIQRDKTRRSVSVSRSVKSVDLSTSPPSAPTRYDTQGASGSRGRRSARKSLVGKGELEACTFQPQVHALPAAAYGSHSIPALPPAAPAASGMPFEERVIAWAMARREESKRKADEAAAKALAECTFKPAINASSKEVAARRASGAVDIHSRLYAQARTPAPCSGGAQGQDYSSALRLFQQEGGAQGGAGASATPRALSAEEEEMLRECTFKPKTNMSSDALPVRSRYMEQTPRGRRPPPLPSGMEEATFRPRVNPVKADAMPAAAVYVQAPIYERLAKTHTKSQVEREKAVAEDMTRLAWEKEGAVLEAAGEVADRFSVARRGSSVDREGSVATLTAEEKEERRRALADFLARQAEAESRKKVHVDAIRHAATPIGQPALCEKSLRLMESKGLGGFLDRLNSGGIIKEQDLMKSKARLARDPNCTFHPTINPSSRALQARSVTELSRGDALKRESAVRMLRLRAEQEDLEGITFQPHINARSRRASEGKLRVLSDPDSYVARVQREAAEAAQKARRAAAEYEKDELRECTFKPVTNDAPEYVKRIARSMALARAVKAPEAPLFKPDWK